MSIVAHLIAEAEALESAGRPGEALQKWRAAADLERTPEIVARLGRLCSLEGHDDEAERILLQVISRNPSYPDARFFLGFHYKRSGRLEAARTQLEAGLGLLEWGPAFTVLGEVYRELDLVDAARDAFETAARLDASDSEAWYGLGLTYRFEDTAKATELFRRSVNADSQHVAAHRELGHMYWRAGDLRLAEKSVRTAISLDPRDAWAHYYLGQILLSLGDPSQAQPEFEVAIKMLPDVALLYCGLGDALARRDLMQAAEMTYAKALILDVGGYLANLRYGQILAEKGLLTKALTYAERALKARPTDHRAQELIARLKRSMQ